MSLLYGRSNELTLLNAEFSQDKSNLIAIYGRRRIGKSYFLKHYCKSKSSIIIEGIENQATPAQILNFQHEFYKQTKTPLLKNAPFQEWTEVFDFITTYLSQQDEKIILVIDELQWMAAKKTKLIGLIKMYWDREWKDTNKLMLILCGSIATFMIDQVIHSKALYGRIDLELQITELPPGDIFKIPGHNLPIEDLFKYFLIFGGVPKYFERINPNQSFVKNIEKLYFNKSGFFYNEIEKIFYAQFNEVKTYERIVKTLDNRIMTSEELAKKLKITSGGGFNRYLNILTKARFISDYKIFGQDKSKIEKHKVTDEFLRFYFKFVAPRTKLIESALRDNLFKTEIQNSWKPWLGFAFENFCLKYNAIIAEALGIKDQVTDVGPYFIRSEDKFQIDLLFKTNEKEIYLCECKYSEEPISGEVIPEVQRKIELYKTPKGYALKKVLIAPCGATTSVVKSKYFDYILTYKDLV